MEKMHEEISGAVEVGRTQHELSAIEKLPENTVEEMRKKWSAYNDFANKVGARIPMIHSESGGNEPFDNAQEFTADDETQNLLISMKERAGSEMARLNDEIQKLMQLAA